MAEQTVPAAGPGDQPGGPFARGNAREGREHTRADEIFVAPPVDIYEDEQGLVVVTDLPGVAPEQLDIRVEQRVLTLTGRPQHAPSGTPLHREYDLLGFYRQFQLPEEVDTGRIEAELRQGVLTLRLPRAAQAQPRRIDVRAG